MMHPLPYDIFWLSYRFRLRRGCFVLELFPCNGCLKCRAEDEIHSIGLWLSLTFLTVYLVMMAESIRWNLIELL